MVPPTGCDGVVVGRGCLGRPWLFRDLAAVFAGSPVPAAPTLGEVGDVMVEHFDLLADWVGPKAVAGVPQARRLVPHRLPRRAPSHADV